MCEGCRNSYLATMGQALPDGTEFNDAWIERTALTVETHMMVDGADLNDSGRWLVTQAARCAIQAHSELIVEHGLCTTMGWIGLLGTESARQLGILPFELEECVDDEEREERLELARHVVSQVVVGEVF